MALAMLSTKAVDNLVYKAAGTHVQQGLEVQWLISLHVFLFW